MSGATAPAEYGPRERGAASFLHDDAHGSMWLLPALLLGVLLTVLAANAHAALYKWTDERGRVHYSDQLPPDAVNRERVELNRQGVAVKKTKQAQPAVQQIAKTDDERERMRQAERERVIAQRRDRALMESYTNESEIDLAKSRAIATIDSQMQSAQAFIAQMSKRRDELEAKKATFAPRPVPGSIEREIETIDAEVGRQNDYIASRRKESATVAARYDADKARFRELHGLPPEGSAITTADGRLADGRPTTIDATAPLVRR